MERFLNNVTKGDTLSVMKDIPANSVDLLLVDLPYGTTQNKWDVVIPFDKLWEAYHRVVKPNGAMIFTASGLFTAELMLSNSKEFRYKYVWVKSKATNFLNAKKQPLRKHEDVLVFYRKPPTYNPQMVQGEAYNKGRRKEQLTGSYNDFKSTVVKSEGDRYPTDILYFKTAEAEYKVYHPTQKPVELARYLIRTFSNAGDVVLDNTSGAGSFLVAALLEGRNFVGIEKNENVTAFKVDKVDYIEITKQRIQEAKQYLEQSSPETLQTVKKVNLLS